MLRQFCPTCHIPIDAGYFDQSAIKAAPDFGSGDTILAEYRLHRNYAGVLLYFAQFIEARGGTPLPGTVDTPGYRWEIRCAGRPLDPYLTFEHIINPWGLNGFPLGLRLPEGSLVQFVVSNVDPSATSLGKVGGRLVGRYWYNAEYGGAPNRL